MTFPLNYGHKMFSKRVIKTDFYYTKNNLKL